MTWPLPSSRTTPARTARTWPACWRSLRSCPPHREMGDLHCGLNGLVQEVVDRGQGASYSGIADVRFCFT